MGVPSTEVSKVSIGPLQGRAFGGQQPIVGMKLYLLAASTGGTGSASQSLLQQEGNTFYDSASGWYYVTTNSSGFFTLAGDYTCTSGQDVYLYGQGGDPGTGQDNPMIGMMAVLGQCPSSGTLATVAPYVWINEVSTVAAAYTLAGYAVDGTHVAGSGSAYATTGLTTAFANAANLVNLAKGTPYTQTPTGNGTVPASTINTVANILAACVNGDSGSTNCTDLQQDATDVNGNAPSDTAAAAINIAHKPAANVAALYKIPSPQTPFQPALSQQPTDFSLTINFPIVSQFADHAYAIAIDSSNDPWFSIYPTNGEDFGGGVYEINPTGKVQSGTYGFGSANPGTASMAWDSNNNLWVAQGYLFQTFSTTGTLEGDSSLSSSITINDLAMAPGGYIGYTETYTTAPQYSGGMDMEKLTGTTGYATGSLTNFYLSPLTAKGVAFDAAGNYWSANSNGTVSEIAASSRTNYAANVSNFTVGSTASGVINLAFDKEGNLWEPDRVCTVGSVSPFTCTVQTISGTKIAIDGFDHAWTLVPGSNELVQQPGVSGSPAVLSTGIANATDFAIDSAGNAWIAGSTIGEVIGVAGPVRTPAVAQTATPGTLP